MGVCVHVWMNGVRWGSCGQSKCVRSQRSAVHWGMTQYEGSQWVRSDAVCMCVENKWLDYLGMLKLLSEEFPEDALHNLPLSWWAASYMPFHHIVLRPKCITVRRNEFCEKYWLFRLNYKNRAIIYRTFVNQFIFRQFKYNMDVARS